MVTVGQGAMTYQQYRAEIALYAVLGAPIIFGADIRKLDSRTLALLTAPEVLAVDQDSDCVQGSLLRLNKSAEVWGKPLHDGSFAVVLLNTATTAQDITVLIDCPNWADACNGGDFYPASFDTACVRNLWLQKDLGSFTGSFTDSVGPQDANIYKFTPC